MQIISTLLALTVYFLPSTTITVEAEAQQETFFAGPYAAFAKRLLNIDVRTSDQVTTKLTGARISARTEADMKEAIPLETATQECMALSAQGLVSFWSSQEAQSVTWRFLPGQDRDFSGKGISGESKTVTRIVYKSVQQDSVMVRIPVEQKFDETKTLEDKAEEAAEIILSARKHRMDIATGNTDATFSGAALADAIAELRAVEEEYLTLFTGYTVTRTLTGSFDVVPLSSAKSQKYLAFRTDPERGLVSNGRGTPYYIEIVPGPVLSIPEEAPQDKKAKVPQIRYRIPAVCMVTLTEDGTPLLDTRIPVYQLGTESAYPAASKK